MARLGNMSAETQRISTAAGNGGEPTVSVSNTTACTIDLLVPRSGKACVKCAAGATAGYVQIQHTAVKDRTFYYKCAFRMTAFPASSAAVVRLMDGTGTLFEISCSPTGHVEGWNPIAAAHPVEGESFVGTEEWHVVEIMFRVASAEAKAKLSWKMDGVVIAAEQEMATRNTTGATALRGGNQNPSATMGVYVDDMAVNDDQGASENTWIGHRGKQILLIPQSTKARTNYTDGAGGITNLEKALRPPGNGVEVPTLAEQQIKSTSTTADVELFMQSLEEVGMIPADTVKWIFPILRAGQNTATGRGMGFTFVSNPAIAEVTGGLLSEIAKAEPTGWRTITWTAYTYAPTIEFNVQPVVKLRKSVSTTDNVFADLAGILLEYEPGPTGPQPPISPGLRASRGLIMR